MSLADQPAFPGTIAGPDIYVVPNDASEDQMGKFAELIKAGNPIITNQDVRLLGGAHGMTYRQWLVPFAMQSIEYNGFLRCGHCDREKYFDRNEWAREVIEAADALIEELEKTE